MIRVILPYHLRNLAHVGQEISVEVAGPVTITSILEAVEAAYPMLRGTIREHGSLQRRKFLRFFADGEDFSFADFSSPLPENIASGKEPFMIVGAVAGG